MTYILSHIIFQFKDSIIGTQKEYEPYAAEVDNAIKELAEQDSNTNELEQHTVTAPETGVEPTDIGPDLGLPSTYEEDPLQKKSRTI